MLSPSRSRGLFFFNGNFSIPFTTVLCSRGVYKYIYIGRLYIDVLLPYIYIFILYIFVFLRNSYIKYLNLSFKANKFDARRIRYERLSVQPYRLFDKKCQQFVESNIYILNTHTHTLVFYLFYISIFHDFSVLNNGKVEFCFSLKTAVNFVRYTVVSRSR